MSKLTKKNIEKYFSEWAIEAGEKILKNYKKWDDFDMVSAVNFMLTDIKEDVKKLLKE